MTEIQNQQLQKPAASSTNQNVHKVEHFLDNAEEGFLAVDNEGIITYINQSLQNIIGDEKRSSLIGTNFKKIFDSGKSAESAHDLARSMEEAHMQTLKLLSDAQKEKKELVEKLANMQSLFLTTTVSFIKLIEARDPYRIGYSAHVARLAMMLARKMGLPKDKVQNMAYAGIFHDLGMAQVPMDILQSATKLTPSQALEIQKHPQLAYDYLAKIDFFKPFLNDILYHHEDWDGSGYPRHLKSEQIPIGARILHVCDAFVALTSKRPYRLARSRTRAIEILMENKGAMFDPKCIDHFFFLIKNKVI